jgi:hypothetical protein
LNHPASSKQLPSVNLITASGRRLKDFGVDGGLQVIDARF